MGVVILRFGVLSRGEVAGRLARYHPIRRRSALRF